MGFNLGDIVVDRIQSAVAEDFDGNLLYVLSQLADGTIETTAESTDAVDAQGVLVKRFWRGKTGTFTANNAMLNMNVLSSASGVTPEVASETNAVQMPKVDIVIKKDGVTTYQLSNHVADTAVKIAAMGDNGAMGTTYEQKSQASATAFAVDDAGLVTLPTDATAKKFIIKYTRTSKSGTVIKNKADKYPSTIRLTLKVLAIDPCAADTLKAAYIYLPSFQVSPETSISLTTDAQLEYTGDLQVD